MKWIVQREDSPGNYTAVDGWPIYDDGFAEDGSDWGDDESNVISNQQLIWQSEDVFNRSFACTWVGPGK